MIWTFQFSKLNCNASRSSKKLRPFVYSFESWDNWTKPFLKFDTFSALILTKMKSLDLVSMSIQNLKKFGDLKFKNSVIELYNYLTWYDTNNVEFKLKFGLDNWISFFNLVIWIDVIKMNWIEKNVHLAQKLNYQNILYFTLTLIITLSFLKWSRFFFNETVCQPVYSLPHICLYSLLHRHTIINVY